MKFVTVDSCRVELERLTQLLVSAFPGSTIYRHTDLRRVPHDVLTNRVDAVLLEVQPDRTDSLDFVRMMRRQKSGVPMFAISKSDGVRKAAEEAGVSGCFVLPDCEQQLLDAICQVNMMQSRKV